MATAACRSISNATGRNLQSKTRREPRRRGTSRGAPVSASQIQVRARETTPAGDKEDRRERTDFTMTRIVSGLAASLDGYIAGPDDSREQPLCNSGTDCSSGTSTTTPPAGSTPSFRLSQPSTEFFDEFAGRFGAIIAGAPGLRRSQVTLSDTTTEMKTGGHPPHHSGRRSHLARPNPQNGQSARGLRQRVRRGPSAKSALCAYMSTYPDTAAVTACSRKRSVPGMTQMN